MLDRNRVPEVRVERRKPSHLADNVCSACGAKVDMSLPDDEQHVCIPDDKGPVKAHGQSWRKGTAKEARDEREKKAKDAGR